MSNTMSDRPLRRDLLDAARYYLRGWRGLAALAVLLAVPAFWLGGPWLVAAGIVPLLVSLAPCLIMCALGLCVMKAGAKRAAGDEATKAASAGPVASTATDDACCASKTPRT